MKIDSSLFVQMHLDIKKTVEKWLSLRKEKNCFVSKKEKRYCIIYTIYTFKVILCLND